MNNPSPKPAEAPGETLDMTPSTPLVRHSEKRVRRQRKMLLRGAVFSLLALLVIGAALNLRGVQKLARYAPQAARGVLPNGVARVPVTDKVAAKIVQASHVQIGTRYNARYEVISYPGGDVNQSGGACTDVVIRSLRAAGYDLQKLMHEDMKQHFRLYPQKWGLSHPDKNIDHRRVPNQMTFFARFGQMLTTRVNASTLKTWQPGDIVCWDMQNGQLHTGIVSDGLSPSGVPLVIHNGWLCVEDDSLTRWKIIGHYRYPKRRVMPVAQPGTRA
jgi:uncharacterized protein YijF (DUF1287 family)